MQNTTRPTQTIELPISKKKITFYTYITAGERRKVLEEYSKIQEKDISSTFKSQDVLFTIITTDFDGSSDNLIERLMDLHQNDYAEVDKTYSDIFSGKDFLANKEN